MLTTDRLILRPARAEDLQDLHAILSNAQAMRYWECLPHEHLDQTRAFLSGMISAAPPENCEFIIERDGRVIGKAGCWRVPEIGFILHPDHWGQGLAGEALRALIPHVFAVLPVDHLRADVDPRNTASLRVLERLGFVEVGRAAKTVQLGEEWCDSVYLELHRDPSRV